MISIISSHTDFFFNTISGYFCLLSHFSCFILTFSFFFPLGHVLILANVLVSSFLSCLFAKSQQNTRFLQKLQHKLKWSLFDKLKEAQTKLLWLITQLNNFSSPLIFSYFFLNIPINAYFFVLLIRGQVLGNNRVFMILFILGQFNGIFGIHCKKKVFIKV